MRQNPIVTIDTRGSDTLDNLGAIRETLRNSIGGDSFVIQHTGHMTDNQWWMTAILKLSEVVGQPKLRFTTAKGRILVEVL